MNTIPVIAIDGPSASGKGTVAQRVANQLGFHYLDSGALYRLVALAGQVAGISWQDEAALADLTAGLDIRFEDGEIFLNQRQVSDAVRSEEMSRGASEVAIHPQVRRALLDLQHGFRKAPGLVADGRDMGSVVFADATTKVFLTASSAVRAERRYKQLIDKGNHANLAQILSDIEARDARDMQRSAAPLRQCKDATLLDTSNLSIDQAVAAVLQCYREKQP
jgi:CMP/dCMP kinase